MGRNKAATSDLKKHLGFWMRMVSNAVSHAFARKLEASGVTVAEWVVLREMYGEDAMPPSDLAERTGLTRGAISKLVDRLVGKDLVTREDRTDDRRFQAIALTRAAQRLVPQLAQLADRNDEEFFHPLAAQERQELLSTLRKLVQAHSLKKLPTE